MVSTLNLDEKYNRVRKNFCFYLDIQDHGLARDISRRIQEMGLQQEVFLTSRVTHVVRCRRAPLPNSPARWTAPGPAGRREWRARAGAMLERVPPPDTDRKLDTLPSNARYVQLTVQKAISLLDKLYDTFFTASRKAHVAYFTKHFIKIEFLDKPCRPIHKEFDEWPAISLEPDPPREKKKESPVNNVIINQNIKDILRMTRKSRPRVKEREEGGAAKGGYCEMCNSEFLDAALHRRAPQHAAFVRDAHNFLALDSLIAAGADVAAFLDKTTPPLNGERRSLRHACNGDRSLRSQSPDSTVNGDDERRHTHNTRCKGRAAEEDRQYYKVVGVSTKLRSSGGFVTPRKDSPPACNGTKPLVVKFRKVRRSELSVLSDEAEQFMFPKRASSTSSTSSSEDDDEEGDDDEEPDKVPNTRRKTVTPPLRPLSTERRRQARPLALKEESSEDDSWPEDKRRRKRRAPPPAKRARRFVGKAPSVEPAQQVPEVIEQLEPTEITVPAPETTQVSPLREEPVEKCMKWEDGKLKYTPAVEQLEFAFESVPHSEPWFETFKRQDEDKVLTRNVPKYFALYSKSPKLPYEFGQLPPLKPNCCPLSDLVKKEEKPGPSRSYGTRGMKKQRIRKRTAVIQALEAHPRKSPREHASTLAILGSAGLIQRRKHPDDTKSTASEDTISDTHSNLKIEPVISEMREASERLQQFLSEVFEDAAEFDVSEEGMEGEAAVASSTNLPDVSSLMSECENCDLLRNEIAEATDRPRGRRGKFKKKNRTGWPSLKKQVKNNSRANSVASENHLDRSSTEPPDDDIRDTISEEDTNLSEAEDKSIVEESGTGEDSQDATFTERSGATDTSDSKDTTLQELKAALIEEKAKAAQAERAKAESEEKGNVALNDIKAEDERKARSSDSEEKDSRKKALKRALAGLGDWLQPVVRVARVDPATARRLRSAARPRAARRR